ncbi:MAG: hypothetical protein QOI41_7681, partial [Myxococcales bacterium]|nr:hypothetical protein [Myxococcales bacterium]
AERDALVAHAARCAACACERRLRVAFADVLREPPAAPSPPLLSQAPVGGGGGGGGAQPTSAAPPRSRAHPVRAALGWLVAVAVFVASAAAAHEIDALEVTASTTLHTEREAVVHTVERIRVAAGTVATRRVAKVVRASVAKPVFARPPVRARRATAESLFEEANQARIRKDYDAAFLGYLRLQDRYPTSREARVSFVTMGRMQLDRADAAGALVSFERYERSGDVELADLAMAGRALALDDVGSDVAPVAWLALLQAHPDSPYASHARRRARAGGSSL